MTIFYFQFPARVLMPNFMGVVIADIVGVKGIGALTRAVLIMSGLTMIR